MAYTTIPKSTAYFDTLLWTGNSSSDSGTQNITGLNFQPDFMWNKTRSVTENNILTDVLRGTNSFLRSNATTLAYNPANCYQIPLTNGFTAQGDEGGEFNYTNYTYATWNWKANGAGSTNTVGSIDSTVSVNTASGFSIVKVLKSSSAVATIGHGLGVTPKMFIVKSIDAGNNWQVYHEATGATKALYLNGSGVPVTTSGFFNNTAPTSTVLTLGSDGAFTGNTMIIYCFADVQGFSKIGSYTGNGNADGAFVYTGFKPAFMITRRSDTGNSWYMYTGKTSTSGGNLTDKYLEANATTAEATTTGEYGFDFLSNGFKATGTGGGTNASGGTYIYMAFAEEPLVSTNGNAATAR